MTHDLSIWIVVGLATAGVIARPFAWPEAVWAVVGAALLLALRLLAPAQAVSGIVKGTDVYLFLAGMMLLSEAARETGVFDCLAAYATRLFELVYAVGTVVTVLLSNDATAVVLTPAVAAAARAAKVDEPLPYLFACALIANAASFVLPISNPANLVLYGSHVPPLLGWLPRYTLPSAVAIGATYAVLRWTQRHALRGEIATDVAVPTLSRGGRTAAAGIAATAVVLLTCSGVDVALGLPTFLAGFATAGVTLLRGSGSPWAVVKGVSWSILPLVAALFVLVEALDETGVVRSLAAALGELAQRSAGGAAWGAGVGVALASNLTNNLPSGLVAGEVVSAVTVPDAVRRALLIGVDLGPNLSVTGSLATILWLTALRREGQRVSAWAFLKLGLLVMPPALILAIGAALLFP